MASLVDTSEDDGRYTAMASEALALVYVGSAEDDFADVGHVHPIPATASVIRFGRGDALSVSPENDESIKVTVALAWASGKHCELEIHRDDRGVTLNLRDLGSRNGTLVAGRKIEGTTPLSLSQVFEVGRSFWTIRRYHIGDELEDAEHSTVMPPLRHARGVLDKVARSSVPVLVIGETGVGKEGIARAIHERSGREGAFIHVGLSAFNSDRIETELGAGSRRTPGATRRARGGTLFVADVGKLDAEGQTALVSALRRLPSDGDDAVRLVAGSDVDLRDLAARHRFRPELYSRLAGFEVRLPPLRDRPEDVGLMVRQLSASTDRPPMQLSTPAFRYLLTYTWPFNREQLRSSLAAASMMPSVEEAIGEQVMREVVRGGVHASASIESSDSSSGPVAH